ncbi:MAG: sulfatase-like hydrolase/transferase [Acidobacteria bacterium]|nr:sulfatase-like hydrolase/transferase [Acidobacteriota bacterium]
MPRKMTPHNLEWITEGALEFIQQNHRKPFFLYMPLTLPHGQYSAAFLRGDPRFTAAGALAKAPEVMPPRESVFERLRKEGIDERNAVATWIDDSVGAILKRLENLGVADNTLVLFASDHGSRGKGTCYEASRVPCVARWPRRIAPGSRIDAICANIDLAPTCLNLAGATPPDNTTIDGTSFSPMLSGTPAPPDWRGSLYLECLHIRAVVTGKWKYIANRPPEQISDRIRADGLESARTGKPRTIGLDGERLRYGANIDFPHYFDHDQLYDLEHDMLEQRNLAGDRSFGPVLNEMKGRLKRHMASLPHTFGEFKTA